jgi:hypothetical protein
MYPTGKDENRNKQHQIQVRLSAIFKKKLIDIPQAFGSFYDSNGEKYCAVSALSKHLGYDIASASKNIPNDNLIDPAECVPPAILETIENFLLCNSDKKLVCFCSRPNYYYRYSLISMLIHLNDYHEMTFTQIGDWLESKEM